jgi:hypothetical protein
MIARAYCLRVMALYKINTMKTEAILGSVFGVMFLVALTAGAEQNLVESVTNGCKAELETYCKDVPPGEGRILPAYTLTATSCPESVNLPFMMLPHSWSAPWPP